MLSHVGVTFPEYALTHQAVKDFIFERFEGHEIDEGLIYAESLDEESLLALEVEDLLKNHGIPYDLNIEDDSGSIERFHRPGQDDVIISQSWGVSSIDPTVLTRLIAETSDADLRGVLMKTINACFTSQVEPLANMVTSTSPPLHEESYDLIH